MKTEPEIIDMKKKQYIMTLDNVKIHEGDVILCPPVDVDGKPYRAKLPICWDEEEKRWAVDISFSKNGTLFDSLSNYIFADGSEIIGNRHDNPEILN